VRASLVADWAIPGMANKGESTDTYVRHVKAALETNPNLIIDDGSDVVATMIKEKPELIPNLIGTTEETTTGIVRPKAMVPPGLPTFPPTLLPRFFALAFLSAQNSLEFFNVGQSHNTYS